VSGIIYFGVIEFRHRFVLRRQFRE